MTSTVHDPLEVDSGLRDLTPAQVLDAVAERRRVADRAEAELLALAVHWVDLHPVTDRPAGGVVHRAGTGSPAIVLGETVVDAALAGEGTPGIAEYAVETLAATLGLSYAAGLRLVVRGGRALLPAAAALGPGPGRSVAGVEGPPGRRRDHHPVGRGGRVRGPAPRRDRPPEQHRLAGEAAGAGARGDAALRPRPGRRDRAGRPGRPRRLVRPPDLDRHHRRHRPPRHPRRPRPASLRG